VVDSRRALSEWPMEMSAAFAIKPLELASNQSLDSVTKGDLQEVKGLANPPHSVKKTIGTVVQLVNEDSREPGWQDCKDFMGEGLHLLKEYDFQRVPANIDLIAAVLDDPEFTEERIKPVSKACAGLCQWVRMAIVSGLLLRALRPQQQALSERKLRARVADAEAERQTERQAHEELRGVMARVETVIGKVESGSGADDVGEVDVHAQVQDVVKDGRLSDVRTLVGVLMGNATEIAPALAPKDAIMAKDASGDKMERVKMRMAHAEALATGKAVP